MFGFKAKHRNEIAKLSEDFREVFVTLACGFDGVACLNAQEFLQVGTNESVRVMRGPRQKYAISGGESERVLRIGNNEFPAKVFAAVRVGADARASGPS
jgi:hypothetical protein